jgi:hypothetical protein
MPIRGIVMMLMVLIIPSAMPSMVIIVIAMVVISMVIHDLDAWKPNRHCRRPRSPYLAPAHKHRDRDRTGKAPKTSTHPTCLHKIPFVNHELILNRKFSSCRRGKYLSPLDFRPGYAVATPHRLG